MTLQDSLRGRKSQVLLVILVGLVSVGLWLMLRPPSPEAIAAPADIVAKFEDTVFGYDFRPPGNRLRKWDGPYHLTIRSNLPHHLSESLPGYILVLRQLTGLEIALARPASRGNVELHYLPDDAYRNFSMRYRLTHGAGKWVDGTACYFSPKRNTWNYGEAVIAIRDTLPTAISRSCLLEELYQGLGPGKNSEALPPSISETRRNVTELSVNDKIILRALYDPRLKPGMAKDEVMKIVPGIVAELVAAVKARGPDALIHPDYRP